MPSDDLFVVAVTGQADLHTAPELRDAIGSAINDGQTRLVIDLTEATFVDSMTLGVLLSALKRVTPLGGRLVVVCPDPHLRRVFEITSLDRVLSLTSSTDEAAAELHRPAATE
jgi:anti-sigma B factor antagonist